MLESRVGWLAACGACALTHQAHTQAVDEFLRARVEQIRESGVHWVDGSAIAAANLIPEFYERREFTPAWTRAAQVDGLVELVEDSYREGLDTNDYHYAEIQRARQVLFDDATLSPARHADLDLLLTDSLIRAGYHLRFGKVDPEELDPDWNLDRRLLTDDPVGTVQAAIDSQSVMDFKDQLLPRGVFYARLKRALAEYRAIQAAGGWPRLDPGPTLRPGAIDERIAVLARRLGISGDLAAASRIFHEDAYDEALQAAVERFQQRHGLVQDGVVGPATLAALNVPVEKRIDQLRANLERTRWVFEDIESDFLLVNIAAFRLDLVRGGETVWTTRVQVGLPYRKTPVFKSSMKYLVFNPTWTVPPTVMRNDILPLVRQDPGALARRNISVIDAAGEIIDPSRIDWSASRGVPYRLVQGPGPGNALGQVKFIFPNEQFVFLHDTPSRELFQRPDRAFSSGCIRVESPLDLAALLLGGEWSRGRIDEVIRSGRTETVFLQEPLTVMLLYWTTEVDDEGRTYFLPDVYDRDQAVIDGLHEPYDPAVLSLR